MGLCIAWVNRSCISCVIQRCQQLWHLVGQVFTGSVPWWFWGSWMPLYVWLAVCGCVFFLGGVFVVCGSLGAVRACGSKRLSVET